MVKNTKTLWLAALLVAGISVSAAAIGVVQRWHGTVEADNFLAMHYLGGGQAAPSAPVGGTGCTKYSAASVTGTDVSGMVKITCGATGTTYKDVLVLTFKTAFQQKALCVLTPANPATALIPVAQQVYTSAGSTSSMTIWSNGTGLASGTYQWNYTCTDRP